MNKFVEKLIERLEKELRKAVSVNMHPRDLAVSEGKRNAFMHAINIAKNLASEHNNGWMSVKDRLPEVHKSVLFLTADGLVRQGVRHISYEHNRYDLYGATHIYWDCEVIAWHPLPELPAPYKKGE